MRPPRISVNTILFALTTVAMGFFFIGMPRYIDDLWYSIDIMSCFVVVVVAERDWNIHTGGSRYATPSPTT